jgi:cell shape-determining protein MreC
LIILFVI